MAAAPLLYECGPANSSLWPGFTLISPSTITEGKTTAGWSSSAGLSAKTQAYRELVENRSRGTREPPPIWTNALIEDAIIGWAETRLVLPAPPGDYELYLLCGTSDPAQRSQYFDFSVSAGTASTRVQIEGAHRFRAVRLRTRVDQGPLTLTFTPRSKWVLNAVVAWTAADADRVQREVISPVEEATFRLPPAEWAKWQREPEPAPAPLPPVSSGDSARGFLVYARPTMEVIFPHTRPTAADLAPEIRLFSPPGETIAANVVLFPLRDLRGVRVTASAVGPIPAEAIEVRHAKFTRARPNYTVQHRYRVVPDALERFGTVDLPAQENARFWLTVRIPPGTPAGDFRGTVTLACDGGRAVVPLRLRVLPIQLREDPGKLFGIYYRHPLDLAASAPDEVSRAYFRRKADLEHADMVAHGTRNVVLSLGGRAADAQGNFSFNWDLLAEKLALWAKHGFTGPVVLGIPTESVYEKHTRHRYGSHLREVRDPPAEFEAEITAMVRSIEAERRRRGWPEFLIYPVDEPSTAPAAVKFMLKVLRGVKAAGVRSYVTADPTHEQFDPLRPYVDVWCTQPFAPDRETVLADSRARGVEYWCYPNHINGENDHTPVGGARMTYGFGFWRSGFRTLIPWIYQYNVGDPANYLDGYTSDFFNRSEPDGTPVPVAMWEAYREGWTDYRYLYTAEQLIAEARRRGTPAGLAAASQAETELRFIWDAIRVQPKYKHDDLWAPADYDVYRWIVAQEILRLQEALGRP
ncbi:MAG: hypothetical protein HZC55_26365 [Verrucomicrobia bacterium]|nr:hypothetical protein [Verrucomicrobiota bacterium]